MEFLSETDLLLILPHVKVSLERITWKRFEQSGPFKYSCNRDESQDEESVTLPMTAMREKIYNSDMQGGPQREMNDFCVIY